MFNRKFSSNIRRRKRMITTMVILLVVCLGLGYSAFSTNLGINGTLNVSKYDQTLYGVLEKAVNKGYAREYTGAHQDSMAGVGSEKIYHWYAPSTTAGNTLATEILDKNNVIFADHCWQMIRTTDTGGVKMIYNGEAENSQCLNTRGNHVGYTPMTTQSMSTSYYYGTSYTYDKSNNVFSLSGTITTGEIKFGEYTCKNTSLTGTCSVLYLIKNLSSGTNYNVVPLEAISHYSQFGRIRLNGGIDVLSNLGYMYTDSYEQKMFMISHYEYTLSTQFLNTNLYYADSYDYNETTADKYTLTNPYKITSSADYPSLIGKYTLLNSSSSHSATSVYYISQASSGSSSAYMIEITGGNDLTSSNYTYIYGDSYVDNGNGTYTIDNPGSLDRLNWYANYTNIGKNKYICRDAVNNTCTDLKYTFDTYANYISHIPLVNNFKYSNGFTYSNGRYILNDNSVSFWNMMDNSKKTSLKDYHYTCFNVSGECEKVFYIYYINVITPYGYYLSNGKSIEDALNEMLYDNVNQYDSDAKFAIEAWYKKYLSDYTNDIEDIIYCNDRSIKSLGAFNPNGGSVTAYLTFKNNSSNNSLECTNITDRFSVSNNNAKLKYPVGLVTGAEVYMPTNKNIRNSEQNYWTMSPSTYSLDRSYSIYITDTGSYNSGNKGAAYGARPVISLKPGTEYASGDGSMANPYVIE